MDSIRRYDSIVSLLTEKKSNLDSLHVYSYGQYAIEMAWHNVYENPLQCLENA